MKHPFLTVTLLGVLGSAPTLLMSTPAEARNAAVENALQKRADLSSFYQAMVTTGVINELRPNVPYTVFAPTNEALAEISPQKYPCFYAAECKEEVAEILRNHIVVGEHHLNDALSNRGAFVSVNDRHITVGSDSTNNRVGSHIANSYLVDGHRVVSENQLMGGVVYKINGVIASESEMGQFIVAPMPLASIEPQVITRQRVYYSPDGRPDGATTVQTITFADPAVR